MMVVSKNRQQQSKRSEGGGRTYGPGMEVAPAPLAKTSQEWWSGGGGLAGVVGRFGSKKAGAGGAGPTKGKPAEVRQKRFMEEEDSRRLQTGPLTDVLLIIIFIYTHRKHTGQSQ
ncbi:hypothetical protein NL676_008728 [Syzygium grande]|nr:hypothetical protein NL676_008728 [Syzygium grande]